MICLSRARWLAACARRAKCHQLSFPKGLRTYVATSTLRIKNPSDNGSTRSRRREKVPSPPEDFHEHLLNAELPQMRIKPMAWIFDRKAEVLRQKLPREFVDNPLAVLQSEKANVELVGRCLELFVVETHSQAVSLDAAREVFVESKPGTSVMRWLLGSGVYEDADLSREKRLLNCLIHCLAAEGKVELIWDWLRVDHTPRSVAHLHIRQSRSWKGVGLMKLIQNEVFWADENTAISTFLRAKQWSHGDGKSEPRSPGTFIPCHQAGIWLYRRLVVGPDPDTFSVDVQLYEDFIRAIPVVKVDHFEQEMSICNLFLRHPTKATAEPAFSHIMAWGENSGANEYMDKYLGSNNARVMGSIRVFVLRTAQMLQRENKLLKAKHVLDVASQRRPDLFAMIRGHTASKETEMPFFLERPPLPTASRPYAPTRTYNSQQSARVIEVQNAFVRQGFRK